MYKTQYIYFRIVERIRLYRLIQNNLLSVNIFFTQIIYITLYYIYIVLKNMKFCFRYKRFRLCRMRYIAKKSFKEIAQSLYNCYCK